MYGDPNQNLSSWMKSQRVDKLRNMLRCRGLSTEGTKPVLLHRLKTELPQVRFRIDSRECMQRAVHSFLCYFGWDSDHMFDVSMSTDSLTGFAADPFLGMHSFSDGPAPHIGAHQSLNVLGLRRNDVLDISYDEHTFKLFVEGIHSSVLLREDPQVSMPTRVALVEKGPAKMSPQYIYGNEIQENFDFFCR